MQNTLENLFKVLKSNFSNQDNHPGLSSAVRGISWNQLFGNNNYSKIKPIIYFTLKKHQMLDLVPAEVLTTIKEAYLSSSAQNMRILNELDRVLTELEKGGIEVLIFKGAAFAEIVYPHFGLRPMSDVDILVRNKTDLQMIESILNSIGYHALGLRCNDSFINGVLYETTFVINKPYPLLLDIHFRLPYLGNHQDHEGKTSTDRVWENAYRGLVAGHYVWLMRAEDSIPHLIAHNVIQHHSKDPILYCDLGFIVKTFDIDWSEVEKALEQSPTIDRICSALEFAARWFDIKIPTWFIENMRRRYCTVSRFRRVLTSNSKMSHVNLYDELALTGGRYKQGKIIMKYLFPSISYMKEAYKTRNAYGVILAYLYRPIFISTRLLYLLVQYVKNAVHDNSSSRKARS